MPSSGPANVTTIVLGPTNVSVSWQQVPRLDQNGHIEGYRVGIDNHDMSLVMREPLSEQGTFSLVG